MLNIAANSIRPGENYAASTASTDNVSLGRPYLKK
jgi:hypothetical protein